MNAVSGTATISAMTLPRFMPHTWSSRVKRGRSRIQRGAEIVAEHVHDLRLYGLAAIHCPLPDADQPRDVLVSTLREMARRQRQALALRARIADRHAVHVRKSGQHAAVEQCQRRPMVAAIP